MAGLKALLDGLARDAPLYEVVDRAERAIRRRRRMIRLAPVAAGLAVVLVLGAGWALLRDADPQPVIRPGTPATWLPAQLAVMADPPQLPTDQGIGPAALLYFPTGEDVATGAWRVVTSDGRQYTIAATMDDPASDTLAPASLSPDGRWLVVHRRRGLVLRDLTGTSERVVTLNFYQSARAFWSLDSRRLVLVRADAITGADVEVVVVDVDSGVRSTSPLAVSQGAEPLGIDRSGDLVLRSWLPGAVIFWFIEPTTGRERRRVTFDDRGSSPDQVDRQVLNGGLFDGESLLVESLRGASVPNPESDGPATKVTPGPSSSGELLVVDFNTGKVTARYAIPERPTGAVKLGSAVEWSQMVGASPEAVLFLRVGFSPGATSTDPAQQMPWPPTKAVEQLDRKTGAFWVVTSITGEIERLTPRGVGLG